MSIKSIVDNIAGSATTASFAIPEAGPIVAGILAAGKSIFDIFYPPDKIDPDLEPVNVQQFRNAMTDMKVFISEEMDEHDRKNRLSHGVTYLQTYWDFVNHPDTMNPTLVSQGGDYTAGDIQAWKDKLTIFANPLLIDDDPFLDTLNWLDLTPKNRNANLDMYMYFINLFMNYSKLAMTWESMIALKAFNLEHKDNSVFTNFYKAKANYNRDLRVWNFKKSRHPGTEGRKPVLPPKPAFNDDDYGRNSQYAKEMVIKIKPYIEKVRAVVDQAHKDWNTREETISAGLSSFSIGKRKQKAPSNGVRQFFSLGLADTWYEVVYWINAPQGTPGTLQLFGLPGVIVNDDWTDDDGIGAKDAMPRYKEKYKNQFMKTLGKKYHLENLTVDDLNKYSKIIQTWDDTLIDIEIPPTDSTALLPPPPPPPPPPVGEGGALTRAGESSWAKLMHKTHHG